MKNNSFDPDIEYARRIQKALAYYELEEADLGKLIGTNSADIRNVIALKRTMGLMRAHKIAMAFGLRYYEFANPKVKLLPRKELPQETRDAIAYRKIKGPSNVEINTELDLPLHTMEVLSKLDSQLEFTPFYIYELLPDQVKSQITASRITVLFKNGSLSKFVQYISKKEGKRHLYSFISEESKTEMLQLLEKKKNRKRDYIQ